MAGNGPPPNPSALRRNTRPGLTVLPFAGRTGRSPKWPLPDNPTHTARIEMLTETIEELEEKEHLAGMDEGTFTRADATRLTRTRERLAVAKVELRVIRETETELWRELWHTPQAVEWERLRWTREVAQYVRWKALAEVGNLDAGKESRQYADRLGLTPKGMRGLMWTIAVDEVKEKRDTKTAAAATGTDGPTARRRNLSAVDNSGAE